MATPLANPGAGKLSGGSSSSALATYLRHTAAPLPAAALTLPLLVLYGLGILVVPEAHNGVDLVSQLLMNALSGLGSSIWLGYLSFYGTLTVINLALIYHLRQTTRFSPRWFWTVLAESAFYAVLVGTISGSITADLTRMLHAVVPMPLATAQRHGPLAGVIISAGAGLHEELVFRLGGVAGVARLWIGSQWRAPSLKLAWVLIGSSVLFSAIHHVVEPFSMTAFIFRSVAGLLFGSLFLLRGFAVAAWTHALYDVWVIVVLGR